MQHYCNIAWASTNPTEKISYSFILCRIQNLFLQGQPFSVFVKWINFRLFSVFIVFSVSVLSFGLLHFQELPNAGMLTFLTSPQRFFPLCHLCFEQYCRFWFGQTSTLQIADILFLKYSMMLLWWGNVIKWQQMSNKKLIQIQLLMHYFI